MVSGFIPDRVAERVDAHRTEALALREPGQRLRCGTGRRDDLHRLEFHTVLRSAMRRMHGGFRIALKQALESSASFSNRCRLSPWPSGAGSLV